MNFKELTASRYSVRKFNDTSVEKEKIDAILEAARIAPTASNRQPHRILTAQSDEDRAKIDLCTPCRFGAPVVFIICYDKESCWVRSFDGEKSGQVDVSIVTTYMMLQAAELGLGTTWLMYFDPAETSRQFNLPESIVPTAMLILGYAADDAKPSEKHFQRNPIEQILL